MASQKVILIKRKDGKAKGMLIDKRSIGTIIIDGKPHSYNRDKINIPLDKEPPKRKKKFYLKKKTKKGWFK